MFVPWDRCAGIRQRAGAVQNAAGAADGGLRGRRGRRTSSPPQFGQMPFSAFAQVAQKVHS